MRASVVIPTHNRRDVLRQTLDALGRQSFPAAAFEVVVVADGCVDGTEEMVTGYDAPFRLQVVAQPASGPAAARNAGAAHATGELLIFVDDDIEVGPGFVEAHVGAHAGQTHGVALGYLPPVLAAQQGLFQANLRMWWEDMFHPMRDPGYRFTYKNLLSGNFSVARALFDSVGGFDTRLRVHEDYELGYRLLQAGARFRFAEDAMGLHHEKTDLNRSLARKYDEGRADVQLGQRYPALMPTLPLHRGLRRGRYGLVQRLLFRAPRLTMAVVSRTAALLPVLERLGMRRPWHQLLYLIQHGWYWRGVVEELPSRAALQAFLQTEPPPHTGAELVLDLRNGLAEAEAQLDRAHPTAIRLWYGSYAIGHFAAAAGTEGFRGPHLRPLLRYRFKWPIFVAMLAERVPDEVRFGLLEVADRRAEALSFPER